MKNEPVIVERTFKSPIKKVWAALTENEQLKHWYFQLADFKPQVGFEFEFTGGTKDGIQYLHYCKITEVVPGKKIAYSWRYEGYPGDSHVTFELFEEGNETRLKVTHTGLETFPADKPDFAKNSFLQGWTSIVNTSLKNYLEGTQK